MRARKVKAERQKKKTRATTIHNGSGDVEKVRERVAKGEDLGA